jgi:glycosyltransferase involved in cell wall biosynthesis
MAVNSEVESPRYRKDKPSPEPVFGFILLGGALSGAQVRDVRLANELADRGFRVRAWWAMDRPQQSPLRKQIPESWLFSSFRLWGDNLRALRDRFGRIASARKPDLERASYAQRWRFLLDWSMKGLVRDVCTGVENDPVLIREFAREIADAGVTHIFPNVSILGAYAIAVRKFLPYRLRFLVTFQGYELYANYARKLGCEREMYRRLFEIVEHSDYPAIAVSAEYLERINDEIGIPLDRLHIIPPGVPTLEAVEEIQAKNLLGKHFAEFCSDLPLVSYVGRRDTEKGIDLLLYSANILRRRGYRFQLATCGPSSFGDNYIRVCQQIAENMRCPVMWSDFLPEDVRSALFTVSRCIVYPSIHGEPFGMVPVEAMAHGTPCLVPDSGGVSGVTRLGRAKGGLNFRAWDTGHLADQLARLLEDEQLWLKLSADARRIAAHYSVKKLADRVKAAA